MPGKIFVTGAAGFIGSNLIDNLLSKKFEVMGIDNFDPFYNRKIKESNISAALENKRFHFREGDIRDSEFIKKCFAEFSPDKVIHLAAKAGVRPSINNPAEYFDVNVNGTLVLLEAMKGAGVTNLVFASSSSVYGNNPKVPFAETDYVDNPISPYAASKKAGELLCHTYNHLYGINIFCLRFFTVYGNRQRPDLAINKFAKAILKGEEILLFGDGSSSRDYTYIDDIVAGICSAAENLKGYEIINLGGSKPVSLLKLVNQIEECTGKKAIVKFNPMQEGDVNRTYADISKAKKILNYSPSVDIRTGLKNYINSLDSQL
jgi:UDP-glucuronate 4-epimerase